MWRQSSRTNLLDWRSQKKDSENPVMVKEKKNLTHMLKPNEDKNRLGAKAD